MRNLNFFKKAIYLFLGCIVYPVLSQNMIIEQNPLLQENVFKIKSNFERQNYNLISEGDQKIYSLNLNPMQGVGHNETNNFTVTIEAVSSFPIIISIYNESGYFDSPLGNTMSVPEGTYDIIMQFNENNRDYIVIKELIEINSDITIEADINEAENYVVAKMYNEGGELLEPGLYDPVTGTVSGGNATIYLDRSVYFSPTNAPIIISSIPWDAKLSDHEDPRWSFYINDVSDRYSLTQNSIGLGYEDKLYFNKFETLTGITEENILIENNSEDWVHHSQNFKQSSIGDASGIEQLAFTTMTVLDNNYFFGLTIYNPNNIFGTDEVFEAYFNNPLENSIGNFLVFPSIIDYLGIADPFMGEQGFFTVGNAVVKGENNELLYGSRSNSTNGYFLGDVPYYVGSAINALPFHPKLSFPVAENPDLIIGNNVPVSSTAFIENSLKLNYVGRYGERRESDFFATEVEIKRENEIIFSGNYIDDDFLNYTFPESGNFDVKFTNTNINVEGIPSKNTTQLSFNKISEDFTPPTLQQLQFRNTDGKVTEYFFAAETGSVRLSAGDFHFNMDHQAGQYTYEYISGNTVELYYSEHDQNQWTELELTEYPEHFFMPAFGDYYEASLESVIVPENDSWFDVKIICTDAAGNKQEQIVSPAFKIEQATMGIEEVDRSGFTVYPNPFTNELNIQLLENVRGNYTFRVSDMTGKTIYTKNQNDKSFVWNGSSLPKGVYILSIENNGKVMAKKVIKK